jgi:hypothetical protein
VPYKVVKRGDKYLTINKDTGDVKGTHDSEAKALAQMRLLYGVEHGMKPKKNFSRKAVESLHKKETKS